MICTFLPHTLREQIMGWLMHCHAITLFPFPKGPEHGTLPNTTFFDGPRPPSGFQPDMAISDLDKSVQVYCEVDVVPSTKRSYASANKPFESFCSELQIRNPFPVTVSIVLLCSPSGTEGLGLVIY